MDYLFEVKVVEILLEPTNTSVAMWRGKFTVTCRTMAYTYPMEIYKTGETFEYMKKGEYSINVNPVTKIATIHSLFRPHTNVLSREVQNMVVLLYQNGQFYKPPNLELFDE
jgi:hypothetical protein